MKLKRIKRPNDPDLVNYWKFLRAHYTPAEVDPLHIVQGEIEETLRGEQGGRPYPTPHFIHVAKEGEEIVAAAAGNYMKTGRGRNNHAIGFTSYLLPEELFSLTGSPASRLHERLEERIRREARRDGRSLDGIFVETDRPGFR